MLQNDIAIEDKYRIFVEKVSASKAVWALQSKGGWANSHSNEDEEITVVPFWSERAYAKACARDEWKGYAPAEVSLAEFLESWCVEMAESHALAGVNWDANMFGAESQPLQLALDVLNKLKAINSAIKFRNYTSIDDFIEDISEADDE
ncbi:DUF2750 domain-containing protein [Mucilaginibacter terrenus]|uniref:DUF2750 domain-containing protein n=1 Tax=Mucilaginibacter terrenus TaxID=2482727 RepID=A0A3E2NXW8_9SPHI|nr:DUF2750 domain-containing protein [Mucilaginibacter terrenus]RFZ85827.1 DUF2750 domain-containing protein [Mucilaginibacter terrenus]